MMDDKLIRQIAAEEARKVFSDNFKSGTPQIPPHRHNGIDNLHIRQADLIQNQKVVLFASITDGPFVLKMLSNPSSLVFYGFAANNAGGGGATKRAIVNGTAELGDCLTVSSLNSIDGSITGTESRFIQMSNFFYQDNTGPAFQAGSSQVSFAYVNDGSSTLVNAAITSWDGNTIRGTASITSGWVLTGAFLVI